jgi:hypothetical protein
LPTWLSMLWSFAQVQRQQFQASLQRSVPCKQLLSLSAPNRHRLAALTVAAAAPSNPPLPSGPTSEPPKTTAHVPDQTHLQTPPKRRTWNKTDVGEKQRSKDERRDPLPAELIAIIDNFAKFKGTRTSFFHTCNPFRGWTLFWNDSGPKESPEPSREPRRDVNPLLRDAVNRHRQYPRDDFEAECLRGRCLPICSEAGMVSGTLPCGHGTQVDRANYGSTAQLEDTSVVGDFEVWTAGRRVGAIQKCGIKADREDVPTPYHRSHPQQRPHKGPLLYRPDGRARLRGGWVDARLDRLRLPTTRARRGGSTGCVGQSTRPLRETSHCWPQQSHPTLPGRTEHLHRAFITFPSSIIHKVSSPKATPTTTLPKMYLLPLTPSARTLPPSRC